MTTTAMQTAVCTDFTRFSEPVRKRFEAMSKRELYVVDVDGDALFAAYLAAFPPGTNPVVKERTEHDCQTCRRFIRNLGRLVTIRDGQVGTVWECEDLPEPYCTVAAALDKVVREAPVRTVFRTKELLFGEAHNYHPTTIRRYDHFSGKVAARHRTDDADTQRGEREAAFQVFRRGLQEIRRADLDAVLDLIDANGLYRGAEHKDAVEGFHDLLRRCPPREQGDLFAWEHLDHKHARFRNTVIGTLLTDLAEGKDLEQAVKAFEVKVAPANYKRPTAVITQKMVEQAVQTITDLGLHGALARRYARLSDISVNDVLFVDTSARARMRGADPVAALLADAVKKTPPDLKRASKVTADEFVRDILPGTKSLEVFVENRHQGNFVSLTGADGPERPFKWDNNFAWAYDGDVTDSVKQRVKAAGGNVNALLRVSLSWFNTDDLDLHALLPDGSHIYYVNKAGILDVDMNASNLVRNPVENLAFNLLRDGVYAIQVHQYRMRETADVGFAIEVEYGGQVHQHSYSKAVRQGERVECFKLHVESGRLVKVETALPGGSVSQEKWGVKTETLVPVQLVCHSPNHWGDSKVGAKHLIFALQGCKNPGSTRGIFNEYLRSDLDKHRKVFEVLASRTKVPYSDEQVSGVGFTAARGDSVTVVVDAKRAYTLMF